VVLWGLAQVECVLREGVPLYLYKGQGSASGYLWCWGTGCTTSTWSHATTIGSCGWGAPGRGRPPPRTSQSMTKPPRHRLCEAGLGLDMDQCPGVLCPFWVDLMSVFLILLRKSALESAFRWNLPCICIFVTPDFPKNKTRLVICVPRKSTHTTTE
jgi:hypothetical protein